MDARLNEPVTLPVANPLPSYWHEPLSPLAEHRTTDELPATAHTVIVGSGISGAMIAWKLLETGRTGIIMLEARTAVGGATGRNGGHTKSGAYRTFTEHQARYSTEEALKIVRLEHANMQAVHAFAQKNGIDCESRPCNTVDIVYDAEAFRAGKEGIRKLQEACLEKGGRALLEYGQPGWYKIYDKDEAMNKFFVAAENTNEVVVEEHGRPEELQGAFEYEAGSISAYRFTTGILELCLKKGLNLQNYTPVEGIQRIASPDGSLEMWKVQTQRGPVIARDLVLATNGYTANLLPSLQRIIVPLRGQIQVQRTGKGTTLPSLLPTTYSFIYKTGFEYLIPRDMARSNATSAKDSQHIVIGGGLGRLPSEGADEFGTCDDGGKNIRASRYLRATARGHFGSNWGTNTVDQELVVDEWTGIMGTTPDSFPLVGQVPREILAGSDTAASSSEVLPGLYLAAGFNGHGMVLCLKAAEALVAIMQGDGPPQWFPRSFLVTWERVQRIRAGPFWNKPLSPGAKL